MTKGLVEKILKCATANLKRGLHRPYSSDSPNLSNKFYILIASIRIEDLSDIDNKTFFFDLKITSTSVYRSAYNRNLLTLDNLFHFLFGKNRYEV